MGFIYFYYSSSGAASAAAAAYLLNIKLCISNFVLSPAAIYLHRGAFVLDLARPRGVCVPYIGLALGSSWALASCRSVENRKSDTCSFCCANFAES